MGFYIVGILVLIVVFVIVGGEGGHIFKDIYLVTGALVAVIFSICLFSLGALNITNKNLKRYIPNLDELVREAKEEITKAELESIIVGHRLN